MSSKTGKSLVQQVEKEVSKPRKRRKSYVMDLRVHSPASSGYFGIEGVDTAPAMVSLAKVKGLDVIAVTDFYSTEFIDTLAEAAKDSPLTVIPGVDIRCSVGGCNDVIMTCLFPESYSSDELATFLSKLDVPEEARGDRKYLVRQHFDAIMKLLEEFGGTAIPSRMDKTPHRLSVLPLLVEKYGFRTFDLAYADSSEFFKAKWPKMKFNLFSFSNANSLAQLGSRTEKVKMTAAGFSGLREMIGRVSP